MELEKIKEKLQEIAYQIRILELKRQAYALGKSDEYVSPNEINKLKRKFARLSRGYRRYKLGF